MVILLLKEGARIIAVLGVRVVPVMAGTAGSQIKYISSTATCVQMETCRIIDRTELFLKKHQNEMHHSSEAVLSAEVKTWYKGYLSRQVSAGGVSDEATKLYLIKNLNGTSLLCGKVR